MQLNFSINCWLTLIATIIWIPAIDSISATYSSALTTSSPQYTRIGGTVALYYYQVIEVIPYASGTFTFQSSTPANRDMYGYLYKDSFNPFNVTKNLIISNDDGGGNLQFLITTYLQSNNKYILIVTTYGRNVTTSYSVNISGPGNNITVNLTNVAILTTTTQKTEISNTATINNIQTTNFVFKGEVTTERITTRRIVIAGCSPPIITLVPEDTSLTNPAQFRKSQDFSISSDITVNCPSSLSMIIKWTVHNCTNVCSSPIELNESIITTSSELFIPARTLHYGLYQFKINVQMSASSALNATETAYISITQSGITANLVPLGTSIVSSGQEKDLILDPGNYSINPDEPSFNASDWQYSYYCRSYDLFDPTNIVPLQKLDQVNHQCFIHHIRTFI